MQRAIDGERIVIHEGVRLVLLQPLSLPSDSRRSEELSARDALCRLQSQPRLTPTEAEAYLREVRTERLADGGTTRE